jgi:hypothetical protein
MTTDTTTEPTAPAELVAAARAAMNAPYDGDDLTVTEILDLRAAVAAVLERLAEENWIVPKIPHNQGAPVGPRILRDGWIRREAGESDVDHTRMYAAQLLAAADVVEAARAKDAA